MDSARKKSIWQESGRWLRVGALSLSIAAPLISGIVNRLRAQVEAEEALARAIQEEQRGKISRSAHLDELRAGMVDRLHAMGANLSEIMAELRAAPDREALIRRGEELTEDLIARGRLASHNLVRQQRSFWIAFGFGIGLPTASVITFLFLRQRLQRHLLEEEEAIQLPSSSDDLPVSSLSTRTSSVSDRSDIRSSNGVYATGAQQQEIRAHRQSAVSVKERLNGDASEESYIVRSKAAFVGVVSTKLYYPVSTSTDKLSDADGRPVDVVFFASEAEAQERGFTPDFSEE